KCIFVGNLPFNVKEESLWQYFSSCGDIVNVRVVRDKATSVGKGIAYVEFQDRVSVSLALELNETELEGRKIRV
ncbi:hypothetical protein ROZALSC1DRAFT_5348, partial [Rozella allomycis CSF55]